MFDVLQRSSSFVHPATSDREIAERGVQGSGEAIAQRDPLEQGFGVNLQHVRVHSGQAAQAACEQLGAEAYAVNDRIAVRAPPTPWLLAHEVAHTLQQKSGNGSARAADTDTEADADRAATAVTFGQHASIRAAASPDVPQLFRFTSANQKTYSKATAYLRDEMPKVVNNERLLKAVVDGGRSTDAKARAGLAWDKGPWVTPTMLGGTRAGRFIPHRGSQEVEVHQGELDKWQAETDPALNEANEFWLETTVLHEYVHYLGDDREKDKGEEWGGDFEEKAYGMTSATRDAAAWNLEHFLRARFGDGEYELKVTGKEAAFKQRFRVAGADAGDGTYDGVMGTSVKISKLFDYKNKWEIFVEHDDGSGTWKPSKIRLIYVSIGDEWLIRTEDWADRDFNDLEISVKKTASAKPPPARRP